jgi:hypothetical protein
MKAVLDRDLGRCPLPRRPGRSARWGFRVGRTPAPGGRPLNSQASRWDVGQPGSFDPYRVSTCPSHHHRVGAGSLHPRPSTSGCGNSDRRPLNTARHYKHDPRSNMRKRLNQPLVEGVNPEDPDGNGPGRRPRSRSAALSQSWSVPRHRDARLRRSAAGNFCAMFCVNLPNSDQRVRGTVSGAQGPPPPCHGRSPVPLQVARGHLPA